MPIRIKLIIMSFLFLAVPSLLIGIIGYHSSANSLNTLGAKGLQTDVRMTIETIDVLQKQVEAGKVSLSDAQEEVKEAILGKKDANGKRPINPRLNLGKHGFLFIINSAGLEIAHPNFEGMNVWNIKTIDGVYSTKEVVKAANRGGGYVTYKWPLPDNPKVQESKITYAEKDPNWGWIVCAGAYLPDFNAGAHRLLYVLLITLGISLLVGVIVILWFSKKLAKPILQVAEHAKLIAHGDYSLEPIETTSRDEIEELVTNFNIMLENQKRAEEQIHQHEEFLQSVTTHMGEGLIVMNAEGKLIFINPVAELILGCSKEDYKNQNLHDTIHRRIDGSSFPFEECPSTKSSQKGEVYRIAEDWFLRKDRSLIPVSYVTCPFFENGNVTGSIIVFRDISKQKEYQKRIEYMAFHDDLTKLPNLRYIKGKLIQNMLAHLPFALFILDIDRFKHINEALGYAFGDVILQSVASRLKEQFPPHVLVGRMTGDEFAIVYPNLDADEWVTICKKIQYQINKPMQVKHMLLNVSITIGGVMYPNHGDEVDEFLKHANMALMEAQQQHTPFQMYQTSMDGKAFDRLVLENHLHYALQKNELFLVYQPQIEIFSGQIQGMEALIRWHHPRFGLISPAEFIPLAENTGLIIPIANGYFGRLADN